MVSDSDMTITIYEDRLFAKPFLYIMLLNPHDKSYVDIITHILQIGKLT